MDNTLLYQNVLHIDYHLLKDNMQCFKKNCASCFSCYDKKNNPTQCFHNNNNIAGNWRPPSTKPIKTNKNKGKYRQQGNKSTTNIPDLLEGRTTWAAKIKCQQIWNNKLISSYSIIPQKLLNHFNWLLMTAVHKLRYNFRKPELVFLLKSTTIPSHWNKFLKFLNGQILRSFPPLLTSKSQTLGQTSDNTGLEHHGKNWWWIHVLHFKNTMKYFLVTQKMIIIKLPDIWDSFMSLQQDLWSHHGKMKITFIQNPV